MRATVVIPTYNEAENLPRLVPEVLAQDDRLDVLVVDDGSPDGTGKLADELAEVHAGRVHVVHRRQKSGLGSAYREGFRVALERGADVVIQMDADFSHSPETLPQFLAEIEENDVVLGSRYLQGITVVNWPIERILISWFGNTYARAVSGLEISDATGGFRATRAEWLRKIGVERIRADGYAFQIELNYRLWKNGARMREIPIFFLDRVRGESKLNLRIGLEALWIVWWLRLAHLFGRI